MELIEAVNNKLPFELANIIYSYLGKSKTANLICESKEDLEEYSGALLDNCLNTSTWKMYPIFNNGFLNSWKYVVKSNNALNQIRDKPKCTIDITSTHLEIDNIKCEWCCVNTHIQDYINYGKKCEWCYAEYLGNDVFTCNECGNKSTDKSDFYYSRSRGYICDWCYQNNSESEDEDEDEFWEEEE